MRVMDILNSSRRVMFENPVDGFEYTSRGTCFLCRYKDQDFAVTAGHVIAGYDAEAIRILFHNLARDFVPYSAQIKIKSDGCQSTLNSESDDTDWQDIAIYPLDRSLYCDDQFDKQQPYLIPSPHRIWSPELGGRFIMRGYPHDMSYINYDESILHEQAVQLEADFAGVAVMQHCYEVKFRDLSPCSTLDGLSGTPVFWIGEKAPREHRLAGMILRATYTSATGYFVDANVIVNALEKVLTESSAKND